MNELIRDGEGCIYFVQVGQDGPIKIGFSANPATRLVQLQGSHYERLHLIGLAPGNRFDEEKLHTKLERFRLSREWYVATAEVLAEIEEPLARVSDLLDTAVVAREHLQAAIALLRGSEADRGREELVRVASLIAEALAAGVPV